MSSKRSEDDDDDDPVIETIPMVINHKMGQNLYYSKDMIVPKCRKPYVTRGARIRPKHCILELQKDNNPSQGGGNLHEMTYQSTEMSQKNANIVMGFTNIFLDRAGKVFVVSPVGHIIQMSPKLRNDDEEEEITTAPTAASKSVSAVQVKQENQGKQEPVPVPVTVDIKAQRHPRARFANRTRKRNFKDLRKKISEDDWINLKVFEVASTDGFNAQERMKVDISNLTKKHYELDPNEYRLRLAGKTIKSKTKKTVTKIKKENMEDEDSDVAELDEAFKALMPARDTNKQFYRKYHLKRQFMDASMDANARIRAVLYTARVATLKEIARYVREGNGKRDSRLELSDSQILKLLKQSNHSVCVRGVWVLASEFALSVEDEDLELEAIAHRTSKGAIKSYEELCRDYVLALFQESETFRVRVV